MQHLKGKNLKQNIKISEEKTCISNSSGIPNKTYIGYCTGERGPHIALLHTLPQNDISLRNKLRK